METPRLAQAPQNDETRSTATSFLESPTNLSGMFTYQREPHEESARSWTYRSQVSDGTGRTCFGLVKIAIDSLLVKEKQQDEGAKNTNELEKAECIIPLSCQFCDQSL